VGGGGSGGDDSQDSGHFVRKLSSKGQFVHITSQERIVQGTPYQRTNIQGHIVGGYIVVASIAVYCIILYIMTYNFDISFSVPLRTLSII
jgi:hypothetical protein